MAYSTINPADLRAVRELALLNAPAPLHDSAGAFGPPVLPITPRHMLVLLALNDPVFCGGAVSVSALLRYLYIVGPSFRLGNRWRFRLFCLRWRWTVTTWGRPSPRVVAAARAHAASAAVDLPAPPRVKRDPSKPSEPDLSTPLAHELTHREWVCRRLLHYTSAEFWRTPCITTNGMLALALAPSQPDAPKFDRARDAQVKAWLNRRRTNSGSQF